MANENKDYHAIVDMGSNGIRFSITTLSPSTARILNVIHQSRSSLSLYTSQYSSTGSAQPLSNETINRVIALLHSYVRICSLHGVPRSQIRVVATEATRTAPNSRDFIDRIGIETKLEVEIYAKDVEGLVGAYGVASGFDEVRGLIMDLGGGSTQVSWVSFPDEQHEQRVRISERGSVSLPYGAAALTRRLDEARTRGDPCVRELREEVVGSMKKAVSEIEIPNELFRYTGNVRKITLYLSGGGFRGWGYVLMDQHPVQPYPIPLINGFRVPARAFYDTDAITTTVKTSTLAESKIFRVSARRATQIPAVAFLVGCLLDTLPEIDDVYFCQGGVREGTLFRTLSPEVRAQDPFHAATEPHAPSTLSRAALLAKLSAAIPTEMAWQPYRPNGGIGHGGSNHSQFSPGLLAGLVNMMYIHASNPTDIRAAAALRSTTTGILASAHGLSHQRRAALAIALCESHGGYGDLSATDRGFYEKLVAIMVEDTDDHKNERVPLTWWCVYLGRVAKLMRVLYPAGIVDEPESMIESQLRIGMAGSTRSDKVGPDRTTDKTRKAGTINFGLKLVGQGALEMRNLVTEEVEKALSDVEKAGKRKHWIGFDLGFDVGASISTEELNPGEVQS